MTRILLGLWLLLAASTAAFAQNPQCPTRPDGDDTNACASTAFVTNSVALNSTYISVKQPPFLAKGDGVTDDTAAINAALTYANSLGGATVFFPSGTYMLCRAIPASAIALTLYSNVDLLGAGVDNTILRLGNACDAIVMNGTGTSNVAISQMHIDGNAANQNPGGFHCIRFGDSTQIRLFWLKVYECMGYGVGFESESISELWIDNVHFSGAQSDVIDIKNYANDNDNIILSNILADNYNRDGSGDSAIDIRGYAVLNNITLHQSGNASGIRFRQQGSNDDLYLGGKKSALSNFRIISSGTGATGVGVNQDRVAISNGYIEGGSVGVAVNGANVLVNNVIVVDATTAFRSGSQSAFGPAYNAQFNNCQAIRTTALGGSRGFRIGFQGTGLRTSTITTPGTGYTDAVYNNEAISAVTGVGTGAVATIAVGGAINTVAITTPGSGYTDGTYTNVDLEATPGVGGKATVTVAGGVVTNVVITTAGGGYTAPDTFTITRGLIGGTGSGFTGSITAVTGTGGVTFIKMVNYGSGFVIGDTFTATLAGGGVNFLGTVDSLSNVTNNKVSNSLATGFVTGIDIEDGASQTILAGNHSYSNSGAQFDLTDGVGNILGLNFGNGTLTVAGSTSGFISIAAQAAAGTYNFNLPTSAGTAGLPLLSGGGGATAMSFAALGVTGGGTGLTATTINQILYSSAANTIAGLATANNGVLVTSAGGVPSIGSTLPAAVQGNITSVGTITSGTWTGTTIAIANGGTGQTSALNACLALKTWCRVGSGVSALSHTGDLVETVLATVTLPALITGDFVKITSYWSRNAAGTSTNNNRVRYGAVGAGTGGTQLQPLNISTANATVKAEALMSMRNATNSQVSNNAQTAGGYGTSAGGPVTAAVNATISSDVIFTGQLGTAGDSTTLDYYIVEVMRP